MAGRRRRRRLRSRPRLAAAGATGGTARGARRTRPGSLRAATARAARPARRPGCRPASAGGPARDAARCRSSRRFGMPPSKPAAITVTRTSSPSASSMTAPKMMLASACAACDTSAAASLISNRPRSEPPAIESSTPCAPSIEASSSGLETAISAAATARSSPRAEPMPISAEPALDITDLTSAKSRLIRPGVVIRSVMPETPCSSTWSACLKASSIAHVAVADRQQPVVGDHDEGVDLVAELRDALLGLVGATAALEGERPGDDADGQRAERAGDPGDDRARHRCRCHHPRRRSRRPCRRP